MKYRIYVRETREILGEVEFDINPAVGESVGLDKLWDALGATYYKGEPNPENGFPYREVTLRGKTYDFLDIDADEELHPGALAARKRFRSVFGKSTNLDSFGWEIK